MLGPWLMLAMFYIVCFLRSWAVNRKLAGLWLLDDLCANPANARVMVCRAGQGSVGLKWLNLKAKPKPKRDDSPTDVAVKLKAMGQTVSNYLRKGNRLVKNACNGIFPKC